MVRRGQSCRDDAKNERNIVYNVQKLSNSVCPASKPLIFKRQKCSRPILDLLIVSYGGIC